VDAEELRAFDGPVVFLDLPGENLEGSERVVERRDEFRGYVVVDAKRVSFDVVGGLEDCTVGGSEFGRHRSSYLKGCYRLPTLFVYIRKTVVRGPAATESPPDES
jgi:hypothetical protein